MIRRAPTPIQSWAVWDSSSDELDSLHSAWVAVARFSREMGRVERTGRPRSLGRLRGACGAVSHHSRRAEARVPGSDELHGGAGGPHLEGGSRQPRHRLLHLRPCHRQASVYRLFSCARYKRHSTAVTGEARPANFSRNFSELTILVIVGRLSPSTTPSVPLCFPNRSCFPCPA